MSIRSDLIVETVEECLSRGKTITPQVYQELKIEADRRLSAITELAKDLPDLDEEEEG